MATGFHLLIPYAAAGSPAGPEAPPDFPALPNLQRLLARMAPERTIETAQDGPSMPHELALAAALELPGQPGLIPWAAHETGIFGTPCALVRLCHWQVGMDQVQVLDPDSLDLTDEESRALLAVAAPWFAEDGFELVHHRPGIWLAKGELLRDLKTISLDRVIGRAVSREMLQSFDAPGGALVRLQNEMQMLFYDHPVTDARIERRQLYPNAIWITGAGALAQAVPPNPDLLVESRLGRPSVQADPALLAQTWREVDSSSVADLARRLEGGADVRLTLAGEQRAITFAPRRGGWVARISQRFKADSTASVLAGL